MRTKATVNRTYKASVFELLYRDKRKLLELYNGLNGTEYSDPNELEMYTLENAIYMGMKNDVSFILASEMNLYEHQSTINPNMPIRDLFYISKQLEKYVKDKSIYSSSLVKIPVPRFIVFYNGTEEQPEKMVLRLSDSYEKAVEEPELELKVTMMNINLGYNRILMEKCKTLNEYMILVTMIRSYAKEMPIEEAVDLAVTECIKKDVLREFLTAQRMEVVAVSILEWDEEIELEKLRRTERAAAMEELRDVVEAQVREELSGEVAIQIKAELRRDMEAQIKEELRRDVEAQIKAELRKGMEAQMKEELRREVEAQVRKEIEAQLREHKNS